jgi:hypothetical protein
MKPSLALVLFACASFAVGCSSSPLTGSAETDSAGASAGPTSNFASYPAGPYGTVRGATIANLSFLGWKHPDQAAYDPAQFETVRLSDFYDPDGHTGVKLLAVNASAVWCSVCRQEYVDMKTKGTYATYHAEGVEMLGTLFEDNAYYPAQPSDLHNWGSVANHAVTFPLVLDPSFKMGAYFDSDATPLNMLIDVRTMTIVSVNMGYSVTYWTDTVQPLLDKM